MDFFRMLWEYALGFMNFGSYKYIKVEILSDCGRIWGLKLGEVVIGLDFGAGIGYRERFWILFWKL